MNKISTAVYILIAISFVMLLLVMAKPAIYDKGASEPKGYVKLFNFKSIEKSATA
jgi:hypothetical protein